MAMTKKRKRLLIALTASIAANVMLYTSVTRDSKVENPNYSIEKHDVDQVFQDHNGYKVNFDKADGEIVNIKYFSNGTSEHYKEMPFPEVREWEKFKGLDQKGEHVKIYKDLQEGDQGFANVINYESAIPGCFYNWHTIDSYYVEIHLPKKGKISPGHESWQEGRSTRDDNIKEIE